MDDHLFGFGKNEGRPVHEVETDYLDWCDRNLDRVDAGLKRAIKDELRYRDRFRCHSKGHADRSRRLAGQSTFNGFDPGPRKKKKKRTGRQRREARAQRDASQAASGSSRSAGNASATLSPDADPRPEPNAELLALIKRWYVEQARRHHPDRNPGDPEAPGKFRAVTEAKDSLLKILGVR